MDTLLIRFPDGTREFLYSGREIVAGDRVRHDGKHWTVLAVKIGDGGHRTATVELESDDLGDTLRSETGAINLDALVA